MNNKYMKNAIERKRRYRYKSAIKTLIITFGSLAIINFAISGIKTPAKIEPSVKKVIIRQSASYPTRHTAKIKITKSKPKAKKGNDFKPLDIALSGVVQKAIYKMAKENDIDCCLVMALIESESGFQSDIISKTGDYGLMQINRVNHSWLKKELKINNFLDAEQNVRAGIHILKILAEQNDGDIEKTLMAYHFGQGGANRLFKKGIYTSKYSQKILKRQGELENERL